MLHFLHGVAFNFILRVAENLKILILRVRLFRLNRTAGRSDFLKLRAWLSECAQFANKVCVSFDKHKIVCVIFYVSCNLLSLIPKHFSLFSVFYLFIFSFSFTIFQIDINRISPPGAAGYTYFGIWSICIESLIFF